MVDFNCIGNQFAEFYYKNLQQGNRTAVCRLYGETSCLSIEGQNLLGRAQISSKIESIPYKTVQYEISTCDCQPVVSGDGNTGPVIVSIMGRMITDDDPKKDFCQFFLLMPSADGNYYIANETFRFVVHNS